MTGFWGGRKKCQLGGVEFELEVEIQKKVFDVDKGMPCTSHPNLYDDMKKQWRFEKRDSDLHVFVIALVFRYESSQAFP